MASMLPVNRQVQQRLNVESSMRDEKLDYIINLSCTNQHRIVVEAVGGFSSHFYA
jgi:hypothetical protein